MRRSDLPSITGCAIVMMLPWWTTGLSSAQPALPYYRITNLGRLTTSGSSYAYGVNLFGQVVGKSSHQGPGDHAFVWDNANGMRDLGVLAGGEQSVARAINEAGIIVGESEKEFPVHHVVIRAAYWLPGDTPPAYEPPIDLGTFAPGTDLESSAWDINDADPFQIAGSAQTEDYCDPPIPIRETLGFLWTEGLGMQALQPDGADPDHGDNNSSAAFGLNTPGGGKSLGIVGQAWYCPTAAPVCSGPFPPARDAVGWNPDSFELSNPLLFGQGLGGALDVNNAGQAVGWGVEEGDPCRQRALLWEPGSPANPTNLHIAPLAVGDETQAHAINSQAKIVGANTLENKALLWDQQSRTWQVHDLNEIEWVNIGACGWGSLLEANDINGNEWIVGVGDADSSEEGTEIRAFLLTPLGPCPPDINGDGWVDIIDFDLMLGWWGPCPTSGVICEGDINGDCKVNVHDQLLMLGFWGPCPGAEGQGSESDEAGSGLPLLEALQLLGFDDLAAYEIWALDADDVEALAMAELLYTLLMGQ